MPLVSFPLALGPDRVTTVNLDTTLSARELVEGLCEQFAMPLVDERGRSLAYTLFSGDERYPLSREQTLEQAGLLPGTPLALAPIARPWWVLSPPPPASAPFQVPQPGLIGLLLSLIAVSLLMLVPAFMRQGSAQISPTQTPSPPTAVASPTQVPLPATAGDPTATVVPLEPPTPIVSPTPVLAELEVRGVQAAYRPINPELFIRFEEVWRAYLWQDVELKKLVPAPKGNVLLTNGDRVGVIERREGLLHVQVRTNQADDNDARVIGQTGWIPSWIIENTNVPPTPIPVTPSPASSAQLRFRLLNENDDPSCVSIGIKGISTRGWKFRINGLNLTPGSFDNAGNARVCGLAPRQEVTFDVLYASGAIVPGGRGVATRGSSIMTADWQ